MRRKERNEPLPDLLDLRIERPGVVFAHDVA
jgi:hypothetical protein